MDCQSRFSWDKDPIGANGSSRGGDLNSGRYQARAVLEQQVCAWSSHPSSTSIFPLTYEDMMHCATKREEHHRGTCHCLRMQSRRTRRQCTCLSWRSSDIEQLLELRVENRPVGTGLLNGRYESLHCP